MITSNIIPYSCNTYRQPSVANIVRPNYPQVCIVVNNAVKIAALDVMFYDLPFEDRLRKIKELGFTGTELWLGSAELGFNVEREWPESHEVRRISVPPVELRRLAEETGLSINSFGQYGIMGPATGPFPTEVVSGDARKKRLDDMKGLLTYAAGSGANIVISESGGDANKPEQWEVLTEGFIRELVSHAEKVDAILAIENTPHHLIKDDDDLLRLMKEFESKALGVAFDPANLNLTPPGNRDIPMAIRKLSKYLAIAHAKDSIYGGGPYGKMPDGTWNCPPIGKGKIPWKECLEAYKQIGYEGWLTVEYSYPFEEITLEERERTAVEGKTHLEDLMTRE